MKVGDFLLGIGRPVAYYPGLAKALGSATAAIFLQQLIYWYDKKTHEYLYKTAAELEAETALSYREQSAARKRLRALGILQEKYARLQHQMNFIIDFDKLHEVYSKPRKGKRLILDKKTKKLREDGRRYTEKKTEGALNKVFNGERTKCSVVSEQSVRSNSIDYAQITSDTPANAHPRVLVAGSVPSPAIVSFSRKVSDEE